jgi:hypothetical protein
MSYLLTVKNLPCRTAKPTQQADNLHAITDRLTTQLISQRHPVSATPGGSPAYSLIASPSDTDAAAVEASLCYRNMTSQSVLVLLTTNDEG